MEPQTGFEPAFSVQLPLSSFVAKGDTEALERIVRLKLTSLAWKAKAQSLYHTRIKLIYVLTEQSPLLCITVCSMGFHRVDPISVLCKQTVLTGDLEGL